MDFAAGVDAGIIRDGRPHNIDISRKAFPDWLASQGFRAGAEIGVYKGEYTRLFCDAGLRMYGVDPWKAFPGQGRSQEAQARQDFLYGHAQRYLAGCDCILIRKTSMEALSDFADESLDFVYIDGDHAFRFIAEDIVEWTKKVRKGGIVSGHDYFDTSPWANNVICQVKSVVDAYTFAFDIHPWWTFGITDEREPSRKERYLSWMWFKR